MNKASLRKKLLKQRQALTTVEWQNKSHKICNRLASLPVFIDADFIFAYFSFRQEADLSSLFSFNKKWAFPRCVNRSLVWHLWQPGEPLTSDRYGIQTPLETATQISCKQADLILVPTVAGDRQGYRLGYGGGFYDRLLGSIERNSIPTIGIVFDYACLEQLPTDSWDIKLDFICTENNFFKS